MVVEFKMENMDTRQPLENIKISEICRACFESCEKYKMLFEDAESGGKLSLGDVFFEVVKIESKPDIESSPVRICHPCSKDLLNAYSFIQKSKQNNIRLMDYLKKASIKQPDCLSESPIDIPCASGAADFLQIKIEDEVVSEYLYPEDNASALLSSDSESDDDQPLLHKINKMQCTYCNRVFKRLDFFENHKRKHEQELSNKGSTEDSLKASCDEGELSSNSKQKMMTHPTTSHTTSDKFKKKLKTRCQRSKVKTRRQMKKTKSSSGRFECDSCNKTFAWKKDLFRHEKYHDPNNRKYACPHCERRFVRKDKLTSHLLVHLTGIPKRTMKSAQYFAHHLFSERKFKEIKCMICNFDTAATVTELRHHIVLHNNLQPIEGLENSELVKTFYPDKGLQEILQLMTSEIADNQLGKFYSIVNSYSYEMGISDSDQSDPDLELKYECEVCKEEFNRKHKLMTHQAFEHTFDECPYKCDTCQLKFTSKPVLESHLKYHCKNLEKMLQCTKCPGRFTWRKNFENHRCGKKIIVAKECTTCEVCGKVFSWPRDLRLHKKTHIPDGKAHSCSVCDEKFLRLENLRCHLKTHSKKVIAVLRPKKILCMLCNGKFESIPSLKYHLYTHADGQTDVNFEDSGFISTFYPELDRSTISQYIRSCFLEQKLSQLYMAVNKYGHEMALSDSDSDDEDKSKEGSYVCEVCHVKFPRMQDILQHQLVEHNTKKINCTHKCQACEDQFICAALLDRHTKSECLNLDRIHTCKKCGVKFMWKQNLFAHTCPCVENNENDKTCEICGKKFIWLKDLHRHKRSHIPDELKFQCHICDRKFNRKDNMRAHMKVHADNYKQQKLKPMVKWEKQDENLCRPHGVKQIQCKICLSKHNSIRDLTAHLMTHKDKETLKHREAEISDISMLLYNKQLDMQALSDEINRDLAIGKNFRFYSITNELGYELSLNDSETCSDLDAQGYDDDEDGMPNGYICKLCNKSFNRKFKIFNHQMNDHVWDALPFECITCRSRFVCEKLFSYHQENECGNSEKQFKCKQCPIRFVWKENLKSHEKHAHDKNAPQAKKHPCTFCDKSFLWNRDLLRHSKIHQISDSKFECTWCFRVFMRKDNLKVHMKVHQNATHLLLPDIYYLARPNGAKTAECMLCKEKYSTIHELFDHIQSVHFLQLSATIPNPNTYSITNALGYEMDIEDSETEKEDQQEKYSCEICDTRFNRRFKLLQHQQSLHYSDNIPYKCDACHFKCVSNVVLSYHMRAQCLNVLKKFRCSRCTMRFMWKENLENHESLIHDSARTHNCNVCKREFATLHDLRNHSDCKPPLDVKYFECDLCNRKYNRKDRLLKHVRIIHSETDVKPVKSAPSTNKKFLCSFCGKEVSSSSNLVIHMRRHTGEKPFKCEFCNMGFPRSSDLSCHRRTHTGERPHKCTVCEKAFSRSYKLQTHMRIHSGERPYKCTYCPKSFTQSNDLTVHVRRHTGERPYTCETCGERFMQGTALRNHRRMRGHYEL